VVQRAQPEPGARNSFVIVSVLMLHFRQTLDRAYFVSGLFLRHTTRGGRCTTAKLPGPGKAPMLLPVRFTSKAECKSSPGSRLLSPVNPSLH
jgi:hypothetical protein